MMKNIFIKGMCILMLTALCVGCFGGCVDKGTGYSLLPKDGYSGGFKVRDLGGTQGTLDFIGAFPTGATIETAPWTLCQWHSRYRFNDEAVSRYQEEGEGVWSVTSPNEVFRVDNTTGEVTFQCNASKCYDVPRQGSEPWMHLLFETNFTHEEKWHQLKDMKALELSVDTKLTKFEDHMNGRANDGVHAAQFLMYMTVQNLNPESPDYGKYIWFGLNIFDNRTEEVALYYNMDAGTGSMIYSLATGDSLQGDYKYRKDGVIAAGEDTPWVTHFVDALPHVREAFRMVQESGMLPNSTWEDMYVGGMNIGWEVPGTYDVEMKIKDLDIVAYR